MQQLLWGGGGGGGAPQGGARGAAGAAAPPPPAVVPEWLLEAARRGAAGGAGAPGKLRVAFECCLMYGVIGGTALVLLPCALCVCCATLALARAVRGRPRWRFLPLCRTRKLELLRALCDEHGVESRWVTVADPEGGEQLSVHVAYLPCRGGPARRKGRAFFVHGANSSSVMFFDTMASLAEDYDCYALDLPGFGLSDGPRHVLDLDGEGLLDWYSEVTEATASALGVQAEETLCVGHSLGAMLAVRLEVRHPGRFSGLLLCNTPGPLPTFGEAGPLLGFKFFLGVPECLFQYLGHVLCPVVNFWQTLFGSGNLALFRIQRYSDPAGYGAWIIKPFNHFHWSGSGFWQTTVLAQLFRSTVPTMLAYGEIDAVVPPHQGDLLARISHGRLPCTVVRGAGHGMFLSHAAKLAALARDFDAEGRAERADEATARRSRFTDIAERVEAIPASRYHTSFSQAHTRSTISRLYGDLLATTGTDRPAGTAPRCSSLRYL